jgi:hypothetical protein
LAAFVFSFCLVVKVNLKCAWCKALAPIGGERARAMEPQQQQQQQQKPTHMHPSVALAGVDMLGMHRDLAGYYRQHGFLDTSTAYELAERVIYPNCQGPLLLAPREPRRGAYAGAGAGAAATAPAAAVAAPSSVGAAAAAQVATG